MTDTQLPDLTPPERGWEVHEPDPVETEQWQPTEGPGSGDDRYRFQPGTEAAELPTLPRALARLAWTFTKWAALLVGCFVLAGLVVATVALLLAITITLYLLCIVAIVVVLA